MLASAQGKNLNRYVPDYVLFDLETTGISCNCDEVIEISAVKVRSGTIVDSFSSLVNPGRPIPWGASQVNNITDEMVSDAPTMEEILPVFLNFFGDDVLVGHNIERFDLKFLVRDCRTRFGLVPGNDYVDTLRFAREPETDSAPEKFCPLCGAPLAKRRGRFGAFYGCTGYPQCRYTENIL